MDLEMPVIGWGASHRGHHVYARRAHPSAAWPMRRAHCKPWPMARSTWWASPTTARATRRLSCHAAARGRVRHHAHAGAARAGRRHAKVALSSVLKPHRHQRVGELAVRYCCPSAWPQAWRPFRRLLGATFPARCWWRSIFRTALPRAWWTGWPRWCSLLRCACAYQGDVLAPGTIHVSPSEHDLRWCPASAWRCARGARLRTGPAVTCC